MLAGINKNNWISIVCLLWCFVHNQTTYRTWAQTSVNAHLHNCVSEISPDNKHWRWTRYVCRGFVLLRSVYAIWSRDSLGKTSSILVFIHSKKKKKVTSVCKQVLRGKINKIGKEGIICLSCPSAILKYTHKVTRILTKDYGVSEFKNTQNVNVSQN